MLPTPGAHIHGHKLVELLGAWHGGARPSSQLLAEGIRQLVLDGRLPPGTRLPAERELAAALEVSRTLIARAVERLREDGFVASRRGAGSWVRLPDPRRGTEMHGGWFPSTDSSVLNLAQATPGAPPEMRGAVERAQVRLAEQLGDHGYQPHGLPALRTRIAERYTARGLPTTPEQILVTNGAQHAFALVLRALVTPGERVLVEHPSYPNALEALRGLGVTPVAVPMTGDGWDLELLTATLRQTSPRLAYLIPDFHNPTGVRLEAEGRAKLATALARTCTNAVIDETLVDIDLTDEESPPPMASFTDRAITIGSAGKSFWGGLRLGWIRAGEEFVQRLVLGRAAVDLGTPVLEQLVLAELLDDAEAILARRRVESRERLDVLVGAVREHLPEWRFRVPDGGLSLWCDVGEPIASRLAVAAEAHGLRLAPGARFSVNGSLERWIRLPYTLPGEQLVEAIQRLAAAAGSVRPGPAPNPLTVPIA
ncbi:PLP-dependent aminotransferase family protein [Saccharopolyspora rhizosphaerae]|uniref:PLP-dependent aminotransferase family protein n=1 Tax=Saccharopolyspora rhizosphaerae TaxID=2492662 RepID=A0A426JIX0_9PSEU|nr:PLP-dependent aminotransferase family protein [Saccharopolyspora rhizosphaerae]RRO13109.1 PLP-dependent aminotransferase family protein [Saccharopolyspora rhizosphaerae]